MTARGIGQAIIFLSMWFLLLSSILFLLFLAYSQQSQIGCLPYFHTWCGLSANLACRSLKHAARGSLKMGTQKSPKIRHLGTIAQLCRAISSQLRHASTIGKHLLNSNIFPTYLHNMVNVWYTIYTVWGLLPRLRPSLALSYIGTLLHGTRVMGVSQALRR